MSERAEQLRTQILSLTAEFVAEEFPEKKFVPGESTVPVAGRVFDSTDVQSLVDSSLDFWLTEGRFAKQFEKEFAAYAIDLNEPLNTVERRRQGFLFFEAPKKEPVESPQGLVLSIVGLPQPLEIPLN